MCEPDLGSFEQCAQMLATVVTGYARHTNLKTNTARRLHAPRTSMSLQLLDEEEKVIAIFRINLVDTDIKLEVIRYDTNEMLFRAVCDTSSMSGMNHFLKHIDNSLLILEDELHDCA